MLASLFCFFVTILHAICWPFRSLLAIISSVQVKVCEVYVKHTFHHLRDCFFSFLQAEEAQRLKRLEKRKKAAAMRLLDMEKRQKLRVEEIRNTQKKVSPLSINFLFYDFSVVRNPSAELFTLAITKSFSFLNQDEENLNLKEQIRTRVRKDLDRLEAACHDMESILRGLGINVNGVNGVSGHFQYDALFANTMHVKACSLHFGVILLKISQLILEKDTCFLPSVMPK